jgi:hypothetical protein
LCILSNQKLKALKVEPLTIELTVGSLKTTL